MSHPESAPTALPKDLPLLAVLGLTDPADGDWARLRGLQYSCLPRAMVARIHAQGLCALAAAGVLFGQVHLLLILGWLLTVAASLYHGTRIDAALIDADRRRMSRQEVNRQALGSIANALAWVLPVAIATHFLDPLTRLKLWAVLATLMTAIAILMPGVPMGTLLFTGVVGGAAIAGFLTSGSFDMAFVAAAFVLTVCFGAIESARRFLATKIAEAAMLEKSEVVSLLLREYEEGEADWLWQVDTARRVRGVSPRFAFALGTDPAAIDGQPFIQLVAGPAWESGQFHTSLHDLAERLKRRESFSNLLVRVTIGGSLRWWELSGTPRLDDQGNFDGFRGVGSDVTEQRESSDKIAYLASYDTLTGLPNRMMINQALGDALRHAGQWRTSCAFLMIDLDRFKAVNDTLGHHVGDQLLALVSDRLREQMTDNEICGRLGGDEFAVVIRGAGDLGSVDAIARRVIERLSQPYEVDHHTLFIGASVGSAVGPRDGDTVEELMRNADLALYRSKDTGGNVHFTYEPSLHAHAVERRRLEFSLRRALDRKEFVLHYQPVVDAQSERIVSFEALVRWNSPEHGFVSPGKFIPVAEDTRLIVPIGQWVLEEACREAVNWPGDIKVAVNVSGEQLLEPDFVATVVNALNDSGLPAQRLEVEVTESIFLRDATAARATLERIMALGCGVALDDFGTGYSSLGYLRRLRFTTIKVDRTFVQGAATGNPESLAIIRAVVAMADSLDMSTTAEGVETEAERKVVRELGARKLQGFFFGRPMPAEDAAALFRERDTIREGSAA